MPPFSTAVTTATGVRHRHSASGQGQATLEVSGVGYRERDAPPVPIPLSEGARYQAGRPLTAWRPAYTYRPCRRKGLPDDRQIVGRLRSLGHGEIVPVHVGATKAKGGEGLSFTRGTGTVTGRFQLIRYASGTGYRTAQGVCNKTSAAARRSRRRAACAPVRPTCRQSAATELGRHSEVKTRRAAREPRWQPRSASAEEWEPASGLPNYPTFWEMRSSFRETPNLPARASAPGRRASRSMKAPASRPSRPFTRAISKETSLSPDKLSVASYKRRITRLGPHDSGGESLLGTPWEQARLDA